MALGLFLLFTFEVEVQTVDARELVARREDAREFFVADYLFVLVYGVWAPIAYWRFGKHWSPVGPPLWVKAVVGLLIAAALVDAAENALLLSATDTISTGTVDLAHGLAIPKVVFFGLGALGACAIVWRAVSVEFRGATP